MRGTRTVRTVSIMCVVTALGATLFLCFYLLTPTNVNEADTDNVESPLPSTIDTERISESNHPADSELSAFQDEPPMQYIMSLCPDNATITRDMSSLSDTASFTQDCWAALEARFNPKEYVGHRHSTWINIPDSMPNERLFASPQTDKVLVLEAMNRQECQFDSQPFLRPELNKACNAESLTAFAAISAACGNHQRYLDSDGIYGELHSLYRGSIYVNRETLHSTLQSSGTEQTIARQKNSQIVRSINKQGIVNHKQYDRIRLRDAESTLYALWMRKKCSEADVASLVLTSDGTDQSTYSQLMDIGIRLGVRLNELRPTQRSNLAENVSNVLYVMAAHLGDLTASYSSAVFELEVTDKLRAATLERNPWITDLKFNQDTGDFGVEVLHDPNPLQALVSVITRSVGGLIQLDELGYQYDLPWLVDHLCNRVCGQFNIQAIRAEQRSESQSERESKLTGQPPRDDYISCQQAIEYINSDIRLEFNQSLMLDEFTRVARELEVLDW